MATMTSEYERAAEELTIKAHRFLMLYASSEHDGESWGTKGAVERRARELQDAIDTMRAVSGKPLLAGFV